MNRGFGSEGYNKNQKEIQDSGRNVLWYMKMDSNGHSSVKVKTIEGYVFPVKHGQDVILSESEMNAGVIRVPYCKRSLRRVHHDYGYWYYDIMTKDEAMQLKSTNVEF